MALSKLSADQHRSIFVHLWNVLEPRVAVYFSSASCELWASTQELRKQLRAEHEAVAALCRKLFFWSCKGLREAKKISCNGGRLQCHLLSAADMALLGTLGSLLPALEKLTLYAGLASVPDGVQQLAEGLGAGALPAVSGLYLIGMHVGDAGASALAAALGQGALPRLKTLHLLGRTAIGDAGLVALAPALRRLPALDNLSLMNNPFGDEGLAALVAPPPPAGALPPPAGVLTKLETLDLGNTQVSDVGCAALVAALNSGALPALYRINLSGILASDEAKAAVTEAVNTQRKSLRVQLALMELRT